MHDVERILDDEGIVRFDDDMRTLTRPDLAPHFASRRRNRIVLTRLIKSIIWHAHERIQAGTTEPIDGNIRTFWYQWVKPVLAKIPDDDDAKLHPYEVMVRCFTELVLEHHLFSYRDFGFEDENEPSRHIGDERDWVLVFAEKSGWTRWLKTLHDDLGVSVLALGGAPSALTSEYTARALCARLHDDTTVRLIGLVDYDPAGWSIARAFDEQLRATGIAWTELHLPLVPDAFTPDERAMFRYPLPGRRRKITTRWLEETGGVDGEAYGLEADSLPRRRVRACVEEVLARL